MADPSPVVQLPPGFPDPIGIACRECGHVSWALATNPRTVCRCGLPHVAGDEWIAEGVLLGNDVSFLQGKPSTRPTPPPLVLGRLGQIAPPADITSTVDDSSPSPFGLDRPTSSLTREQTLEYTTHFAGLIVEGVDPANAILRGYDGDPLDLYLALAEDVAVEVNAMRVARYLAPRSGPSAEEIARALAPEVAARMEKVAPKPDAPSAPSSASEVNYVGVEEAARRLSMTVSGLRAKVRRMAKKDVAKLAPGVRAVKIGRIWRFTFRDDEGTP